MRFLVTAGSTLEKIDDVRVWGNIFTGETGLAIARAVGALGEVDLLTSNRRHVAMLADEAGALHASAFATHGELCAALSALMATQKYDAVFMTAAIADYKPARVFAVLNRQPDGPNERWLVQDVQAAKVKSTHEQIAVLGERTEKLVDLFRTEWRYRGLLVKFKLEVGPTDEQLIAIGQASRKASGADYLVANTLAMTRGENAGAYLLGDHLQEWVPRTELAARLRTLAVASCPSRRIL